MHSLKNTAVAVILLGISFGLYQISLSPKPIIDPSQIPALEISDGLSSLGNQAIDGIQSKMDSAASSMNGALANLPDLSSVPSLPTLKSPSNSLDMGNSLPATPKLQLPEFPKTKPPANLSTNVTVHADSTKLPLASTTKNNVQSIEYPSGTKTGNASTALANQFDNSFLANNSPAKSSSQPAVVAQREVMDPKKDQGLIAALAKQAELDAANNSFATTKPPTTQAPANKKPPTNDNSFVAQPKSAQSIGTSKPMFDPAATELVSANAPAKKPDSDFAFGGDLGSKSKPPVQHASSTENFDQLNYKTVWPKVDELVAAEDFRTALKLLSRFYRDENLTGPQRQRLVGWLDALAGKVIFSNEDHLTGTPYVASSKESVQDISKKWKVPAQLIYNINKKSMSDPVTVSAGTQLKQINGPFSAEIRLDKKVMTLFLGDLYAGRFPIRVGISGEPNPGTFTVIAKSETGHAWRDADGKDYPPGSPENGYGPHWIGMTGSLCMHQVSDSAKEGHHGCLGLTQDDAADVFAILSSGSVVIIMR